MATSVPSIDVEDTAERYFGTPERILRRRKLRPGESGRLVSEDTDAGQNESPCNEELTETRRDTASTLDDIIAFLFHLTAVSFFIYILLDNDTTLTRIEKEDGIILPQSNTYGGRWKFITHINFHILTCYFLLALLCDISGAAKKLLSKFLDVIFSTIAFPVAMCVTILFWVFFIFFRPISIGDTDSDLHKFFEVYPLYLNHAKHTAVGFAVLLEVSLVQRHYPSNSDAIKALLLWNIGYASWVYWCYWVGGVLPYPILQYMGPYMSLIFLLMLAVSIASYFIGKTLTHWCWGTSDC